MINEIEKINKSFGEMTYGGYKGKYERWLHGYKKSLGHEYYLNTEIRNRIGIILPLDRPIKLLKVGSGICLVNHHMQFEIINNETWGVLYADDIKLIDEVKEHGN
jgi:hypothetical protein